ncbi:MAG TPA: DUF4313 domain-containing protein [Candidatus Blautia merdipullorum]|nr:DUF4313 domain-containing protein [Candidatus Blautia merdipullorum]
MNKAGKKEMIVDYTVAGEKECMNVWMEIGAYQKDGNIRIALYSRENGGEAPVMELTEDFGVPLRKNQAFLQEGMAEGEGYAFLQKYDLGYLTGEAGRCGVRESQVFEFREEKLRELDPVGYQRFEEIYNRREKEPIQEMPDELKTGTFRWDYEDTEIALYVASYQYGNRLYVEMFSRCEDGVDGWEPFDDLTVNLPGYYLEPDEAYICADFSEDKLNFITDYGLGELLPEKGHSGMEEYSLVKFNLEKLAEFDRVGVEKYCASHGIDLSRKQESLSRSEMQNKQR